MAQASARTAPQRPVLAVFDLDGTLTRGDTLLPFLRFAAGLGGLLAGFLRSLPWLAACALGLIDRGRAKEALLRATLGGLPRAELERLGAAFAADHLPAMLRPAAMEQVAWHRQRGHLCVLLSASPAVYVEPWARAAGFDDVLATRLRYDGEKLAGFEGANCRGDEKVLRLEAQYDLTNVQMFGYGDSPADKAFLARCTEAHYKPFLSKNNNSLRDFVRLMRPHQWLKNGFVLVGILFGHAWTNAALVGAALCAVAGFCAVSSAIYIINDFADRERDRLHPKKRNRPLASGRVSTAAAFTLAGLLLAGGAAFALAAGPWVLAVVASYAALNLAYSFALKSVVILDVFVISAGFLLRIMAGTAAIGIPPSQWLLVCTLLLTLFLGFVKRRSELLAVTGDFMIHRKALMQYSPALLDKLVSICGAGAILCYCLYAMSPETARVHGTANLIYTIPFVAYGMFRYLYLLHAKQAGTDTSSDMLRDPHLIVTVLGWAAASFVLISGVLK